MFFELKYTNKSIDLQLSVAITSQLEDELREAIMKL